MASADGNTAPPKDIEAAPSLCGNGCGFFGNPNTGGMCSKCYKETIAKAAASAPKPAAAPEAVAAAAAPPPPAPAAAPAAAPPPAEPIDVSDAAVPLPAEPKAAEPATSSSIAPPEPMSVTPAVRPPDADSTPPDDDEPPKKVQANKNRCWTCNRKIGLLGFQCKCEYFFCAEHRYSDRHECSFDFKAQGKDLLTKANPTIAPSKMESM